MNLAPIILFVFNRPWHTEQTLEALMANELADESILYIYADGPKVNDDDENLKNINATRAILKKKQWCKEVNIVERDINLGLAQNVINGVTAIINNYDKIIVLEDDIKTGVNFLSFMNQALDFYENNDLIFGVSGYNYPRDQKNETSDTFFLPISCSWSWATWKHVWIKTNFDTNELIHLIKKSSLQKKMNFGGYPFYEMLENQYSKKIDSWAIRFYASMFLSKKWFVYPPYSLVQNFGFGKESTHTIIPDDFFENVTITGNRKITLATFFKGIELKNTKKKFEAKYKTPSNLLISLKKNVKKFFT